MTPRSQTLQTDEGLPLRVDVWGEGEHCLVLCHGFKGFKDWGFFPWLAEQVASWGMACVSFDFSRNGVDENFNRFERLDLFADNTISRELKDLAQVMECLQSGELKAWQGSRPQKISLLGHSRGGGIATVYAADHPVHKVVTWAGIATFDRFDAATKDKWRQDGVIEIFNGRTEQMMPLNVVALEDFEKHQDLYDPKRGAKALKDRLLVIHGRLDETVGADDAEALAQSSGTTVHWLEQAGHTFGAVHPFREPTPDLWAVLQRTQAFLGS